MLAAWLGAVAIGLSLGLLGSGGSILTVPVLVYLVGQDEKTAIAGSLLVVGLIAAVGGAESAWRGNMHWRSVLLFGLPGMAGTYGGAWLGGLVSGTVQLVVFAVVMLLAAALMLRPLSISTRGAKPRAAWKIALEGLAVGVLTGFVGVGGGFLIVPALVLLGGLSMHLAVGTSLVIIAMKSLTGFYKYYHVLGDLGLSIDGSVLLPIVALGIVGSFAGRLLGGRISQTSLQKTFAGFLVLVALFILQQNLL